MALPPHPNPILAVTLPIVLDKIPGTHAPTEALRLALLGVAAVHIAYLRSRSALSEGSSVLLPSLEPTLSPLSSTMASLGLAQDPLPGLPITSASLGVTEDSRQLLAFSAMMRLQATRCLALACREGFGGSSDSGSGGSSEESDAALGATMAVVLIDIFSGGHQWMKNIGLAKALIQSRGGPNAILQQANAQGFPGGSASGRRRFGGGVKVSAARFWLEMLAVYETFGSLTSGEEPTLLAPGFTDWWTLDESGGDLGYHKNSIEKVFGLARSMVVLIAKVSSFLCRTIRERAIITEVEPGQEGEQPQQGKLSPMDVDSVPNMLEFHTGIVNQQQMGLVPSTSFQQPIASTSALQLPVPLSPGTQDGFDFDQWLTDLAPMTQVAASLTPLLGASTAPAATSGFLAAIPDELYMQERVRQQLMQEERARIEELRQFFFDAKQLYREVENWQDEIPTLDREARVIAGNRTHQLAMQVVILREIFHVPRSDQRVQRAASGILTLCLECAEQDMGIDLTWPVIIAGCQVYEALERHQVQLVFDCFKKQCCFEIESSQRIVTEVWRRMDEEAEALKEGRESVWKGRDDWRAVVEDLNLRILVL